MTVVPPDLDAAEVLARRERDLLGQLLQPTLQEEAAESLARIVLALVEQSRADRQRIERLGALRKEAAHARELLGSSITTAATLTGERMDEDVLTAELVLREALAASSVAETRQT